MATDFLGSGWQFPVGLDKNGHVKVAHADDNIRQSIWTILGTSPGERVMRPEFGCGIHDLVFGVNNAGLAGRVAEAVRDALVTWEHRIDVLDVSAIPDPGKPNLLLIEINYQVRSTNSRFNLVYPFYLD
ncbi:MAG: GPW/gp25 family protein [Gammaproteobacteria bacterium]